MISRRNIAGLGLILISFGLLVPGLFKPTLTISASIDFLGNEVQIFEETRSILGTIGDLHESENDFVAGLILLFSVVVPFLKGLLLLAALSIKRPFTQHQIHRFVCAIGKWSMADVFVVGIFVAFLSAKATDNLDAQLEHGFYYVTGYCLVSLLSMQFIRLENPAGDKDHE